MYTAVSYTHLDVYKRQIYDGIIGIDLLNVLDAKIDISNNKIMCNYKGVQHSINMNEEERQYKVSEPPIVVTRPRVQYAPTRCTSQTTDNISRQEEKRLHEIINEYEEIFSETPTQTTVYELSLIHI